jgi:Mn-dependent DtxR family transcriptional regulator
MPDINNLLNDKFRVLTCLYDYRGPDNYSRITQQEISEKLGINRVTINKIFKKLNDAELIKTDVKHLSKYLLTEKAIKAVETLKKIN